MISILRILTRGEGVQNLENLADVIYERPLSPLLAVRESLLWSSSTNSSVSQFVVPAVPASVGH